MKYDPVQLQEKMLELESKGIHIDRDVLNDLLVMGVSIKQIEEMETKPKRELLNENV